MIKPINICFLSLMVMPALVGFGRLKQKDHEFKVSLAHIVRHCLTKELRRWLSW